MAYLSGGAWFFKAIGKGANVADVHELVNVCREYLCSKAQ